MGCASRSRLVDLRFGFSLCREPANGPIIEANQTRNEGNFDMETVKFGKTGMQVSKLCLGCMTYGSTKWREWVLEEEASRPFIREALEKGINFFDTADVYSQGVSEEILGRALKEYSKRPDVVIATKVHGVMGPSANAKGLSRKHIMEAIDASLRISRA